MDATYTQIAAAWGEYVAARKATKPGLQNAGVAAGEALAWMRFLRLFCTPEQREELARNPEAARMLRDVGRAEL